MTGALGKRSLPELWGPLKRRTRLDYFAIRSGKQYVISTTPASAL